jgi:transposase
MTKYSLDIQLAAVQAYLEGKESFKDTAQRFQVDITILKELVSHFRYQVLKSHIQITR